MPRLLGLLALLLPGFLLAQPQAPDTLWTYTYASSRNDEAYVIVSLPDGGLMVGGGGMTPDSVEGALLLRLDANGQLLWMRRIPELHPTIKTILPTADGGFALSGDHARNLVGIPLVKTDSAGNVQWAARTQHLLASSGQAIVQTPDGGFTVMSVGDAISESPVRLAHFCADGDTAWSADFAPRGGCLGGDMLQTGEGDYIVVASENYDAYLAKVNPSGALVWSTDMGTSAGPMERLNAVTESSSGDYIAVGSQSRETWTDNPYAVRVNPAGDTLWTRAYPEFGPGWFYAVYELPSGDLVFCGTSVSRFLVALCAPDGAVLDSVCFTTTSRFTRCYAACPTSDGGIAMAGYRSELATYSEDLWVVRTSPVLSATRSPIIETRSLRLLSNYPNPFNASTQIRYTLPHVQHVSLKVYDLLGREVAVLTDGLVHAGEQAVPFTASELPSGIYLLRLQTATQSQTQKLVLLK